MRTRRTGEEVKRSLREVAREMAKGLTASDVCRKAGIAPTTYDRRRAHHDPAQADSDRRCRELEAEVERLKRIVAESMLDERRLQDLAQNKW